MGGESPSREEMKALSDLQKMQEEWSAKQRMEESAASKSQESGQQGQGAKPVTHEEQVPCERLPSSLVKMVGDGLKENVERVCGL